MKFVNGIRIYKANVAVIGGDLAGKLLVPIVRDERGIYLARYMDQNHIASNDGEFSVMQKSLTDFGYYPVVVTKEESARLAEDKEFVDELFTRLIKERLSSWVKILEERLRGTGMPVYITGGNDDYFYIDEILNNSDTVVNAEGKNLVVDGGYEMISTGFGNETPWKCPRDITEDELQTKIESMAEKVKDQRRCMFNIHVPPFGTLLDVCPKLDTSTYPPKPVLGESTSGGSIAVRRVIEKYQPLVSLHGHIHESRGVEKINNTTCFNPGSEYAEGILKAVLVNLGDHKLDGFQFVSG